MCKYENINLANNSNINVSVWKDQLKEKHHQLKYRQLDFLREILSHHLNQSLISLEIQYRYLYIYAHDIDISTYFNFTMSGTLHEWF